MVAIALASWLSNSTVLNDYLHGIPNNAQPFIAYSAPPMASHSEHAHRSNLIKMGYSYVIIYQVCYTTVHKYSQLNAFISTKPWSTSSFPISRGVFQGDTMYPIIYLTHISIQSFILQRNFSVQDSFSDYL